MTTGRNPNQNVLRLVLPLLILLTLPPGVARGAPSIEVQIGFNGHVVPERYAPARIRVLDYENATSAKLRITQTLGTPWRGTSTVLQEPPLDIASDGVYHTTVPVYDPLNPLSVALIDAKGSVLAEQLIDLRSTRHPDPFPVVYGTLPYPFAEGTPLANALELPEDWWAYDSAHSLWISAAPPRDALEPVARWVFSGGTAVLLSGSDYFRYDSPTVRELLPLTDPTLATGPNGTEYLSGAFKPGTHALVLRGTIPLLLLRPYGAGHMALVTVRSTDLTRSEIELIADSIPPSSRITLGDLSEAALGAIPVARPAYSFAILLGVVALAAFAVCVAFARRRPKRALVSALALFGAFSVLSGLYANEAKSLIAEYTLDTSLYVYTWFGLVIDSSTILWTESGELHYPLPGERIPAQIVSASSATEPLYALMPQSQVVPAAYEHSVVDDRIVAPISSGDHKTFYSYGASAPLLHLAYDDEADRVLLDQQSSEDIDHAWFLFDGLGFYTTSVPRGTSGYSLDDLHTLRDLASSGPDLSALRSLSAVFPFDSGIWFVGQSTRWAESNEEGQRKVRLLTLYVVEGVRGD